jgi:hypothetical protein
MCKKRLSRGASGFCREPLRPVVMARYARSWVTHPDQAGRFLVPFAVTPSVAVTPWMTRGNWFTPYHAKIALYRRPHGLRKPVRDVGDIGAPIPLMTRARNNLVERLPKLHPPSRTATSGGTESPRALASTSNSASSAHSREHPPGSPQAPFLTSGAAPRMIRIHPACGFIRAWRSRPPAQMKTCHRGGA